MPYGTSGVGGTPHIAGELLKQRTGAKLMHMPYKGGGQAMTDALGGNIPLVYTAVAGAMPHVKAGAWCRSPYRAASACHRCPTCRPSSSPALPDFEATSWVAILAPAKTPSAVVDRLNRELNAVLSDPAIVERLATLGIIATPGSPEALADQIRVDLAKYGQVVKAAGIKAE